MAALLEPPAPGPLPMVIAILLVAWFVNGIGNPIFNVRVIGLRQAILPDHLQGRVNASARHIATSCRPIGALFGGLLGEEVGLSPKLLVAGVGVLPPGGLVWSSPVRTFRAPPTGAAQAAA